jgi:thioredoxin-related protein
MIAPIFDALAKSVSTVLVREGVNSNLSSTHMVIIETTNHQMDSRLPPSTVAFVKIDTDKCADIGQKYNVRSMPTFIFIKDNDVVETVGAANVDGLSFPHSSS